MVLHTLNKLPQSAAAIACLKALTKASKDRDALLLLEDGVYVADKANEALVKQVPVRVYALGVDLEARGLTHRVLQGIEVVSYNDFVQLVAEHKMTKAWI